MKLRAGRFRDLGDIQSILSIRGEELDFDDISRNVETLGKPSLWGQLTEEWQKHK